MRGLARGPEVRAIDGGHHQITSRAPFPGWQIVALSFGFDVAIVAANAERGLDRMHGGQHLPGGNTFHHLDVLVDLFGGPGILRRGHVAASANDVTTVANRTRKPFMVPFDARSRALPDRIPSWRRPNTS